MARPSAANLNSLAQVLRQAQPLYRECRSILNYLDPKDETEHTTPNDDAGNVRSLIPANDDAASISHTVFEPPNRNRKRVV